jgi:hypothetical protein
MSMFTGNKLTEPTAVIPTLDVAKRAVWFYHAHIVNHEAKPGDLAGLPVNIETGYEETEREGGDVYRGIR